VPESPGEPYQTTTDADGSYSYGVPEGDYQILAEYYPNDEPGGCVYLEPMNGDGSISLPSSEQVDFRLPSCGRPCRLPDAPLSEIRASLSGVR
jgi:hypothetical protein